MSRILEKSFKYVNSANTDVAATFRRIRSEQQAKLDEQRRNEQEAADKVKPMLKAKVA